MGDSIFAKCDTKISKLGFWLPFDSNSLAEVRINIFSTVDHRYAILAIFGNICVSLLSKLVYLNIYL